VTEFWLAVRAKHGFVLSGKSFKFVSSFKFVYLFSNKRNYNFILLQQEYENETPYHTEL
jgi:hypothetical protein